MVFPGEPGENDFCLSLLRYYTLLSFMLLSCRMQKIKGLKNPHKKVIQKMLQIAGDSINGQIFEIFFNYLVPISCYPDNLIVKLYFRDTTKNNNHSGAIVTVKDLSNQTRKMIHVVKTPDGEEISPRPSFDLVYDKPHLYMRLKDWNVE